MFFSSLFLKISAFFLSILMSLGSLSGFTASKLEYKQAMVNPMKGFMPFYSDDGEKDDNLGYSMEWFYIPMSDLVSADGEFTIKQAIEPYLENISSRGNQAVFRVYLDYPGKDEDSAGDYIHSLGIKFYEYEQYGGGVTPDYSDPRLIDFLEKFIYKLAEEYDGDPRIAYITTGLIGHWGEWHVSIDEANPTKQQKERIITAYENAFKITKILTRYPGDPGTKNGKIGFHDDSFTYETIDDTKDWFFCTKLKKNKLTNVWKSQAIGGEFRPECQEPFIKGEKLEGMQDYNECVNKTHCSFLMMQNAFTMSLSDSQKDTVSNASAKLGYDFYIDKVNVKKIFGKAYIFVRVRNDGVAPIYADPGVFIGSDNGEYEAKGAKLDKIQPGEYGVFYIKTDKDVTGEIYVRAGSFFNNGKCVRFSNANADDKFVIGTIE